MIRQLKKVITNVGTFLYDHLVIATGTTTNYFGNKNLASRVFPLKSIGEALDLRSEILQELEKAIVTETVEERESTLQFVIGVEDLRVGTGRCPGGDKRNVLPTDYTEIDRKQMKVVLIEAADRLLATMSEKSSKAAKKYLENWGVEVRLDTRVQDYDGASGVLQLADGGTLRTRNIF